MNDGLSLRFPWMVKVSRSTIPNRPIFGQWMVKITLSLFTMNEDLKLRFMSSQLNFAHTPLSGRTGIGGRQNFVIKNNIVKNTRNFVKIKILHKNVQWEGSMLRKCHVFLSKNVCNFYANIVSAFFIFFISKKGERKNNLFLTISSQSYRRLSNDVEPTVYEV